MDKKDDVVVQSSSKKNWIILGIVTVICLGFVISLKKGLDMGGSKIPSALLNKPAMDFKADWIQGREFLGNNTNQYFELADFKGQGMILNFWASWCFSCRHEAVDFEEFWQAHKDSGIKVVGIAIQDTPEEARLFARQYGKTYILGLDTDGTAAINYGVTGVPETFVINSEGVILHKEAGPVTKEMLSEYVKMLKKDAS